MPEELEPVEPAPVPEPIDTAEIPEELAPTQYHMSTWQLISISGFWLASNILWTAFLLVLLPTEVAAMMHQLQAKTLGWLVGLGAVVPLLVPLIVGPLSDRCTSRLGRRRPFMFGGVAINIIGLAMMFYYYKPAASGVEWSAFWGYFCGYVVVQIGNNIATGAYQGVIPDVVLPSQRGAASGYMGSMTQIGSALGVILVGLVFRENVFACYLVLATSLVLFLLWTAITLKEEPLKVVPPRETLRNFFAGIIHPFKFPDFVWVWVTRALVMFGFYTVSPFVSYYLRDVIHISAANLKQTSAEVFLLILIAATITGVIGGSLSDRIGRKKIVYLSNALMAISAVILVFCTSLTQALIVGTIFGLGYGAYISVDWALGTDVLPNRAEAGKDMAVWHIAMVGPQSIAAFIAGYLVDAFGHFTTVENKEEVTHYATQGYLITFGVAAVALGLGAILLRNVKKAR